MKNIFEVFAIYIIPLLQIFPGNKNAYQASFGTLGHNTRSLRFILSAYVGQPCMRVEVWGKSKFFLFTLFMLMFNNTLTVIDVSPFFKSFNNATSKLVNLSS